MDIFADIDIQQFSRRLETERFGPFRFQLGFDPTTLRLPWQRVVDAQQRFRSSPLAQVANSLEREVLASSVFSTNTIEGGLLSEEETAASMELDPEAARTIEQQRVTNIKAAYDLARKTADQQRGQLQLDLALIRDIHRLITQRIPDDFNQPDQFRSNRKNQVTRVGQGYKPPQNPRDVETLMQGLVDWQNALCQARIPALIRAPLLHYYFETIHPFWDGNGRTGRVLEATVLLAEGFTYAPFAMARYYAEDIPGYFSHLDIARRRAAKKHDAPNQAWLEFFLTGMFRSIERLHDRVNDLVSGLLFRAQLQALVEQKTLNTRQLDIANAVLDHGRPLPLKALQAMPWYLRQYRHLTPKTRQRDLNKLLELRLLGMDDQRRLWPGHLRPAESGGA